MRTTLPSSRLAARTARPAAIAFLSAACLAGPLGTAYAQGSTAGGSTVGNWRYSASVYGYLPSIGGSSSFPTGTGSTMDVSGDQILDALKFTFMGTFDAHNGRWGVFTDFIYLNLGDTKRGTRDFTVSGREIPAGVSADLTWDLKGVLWTLGGQYRLVSDPKLTVDALAGVRLLSLKPSLSWTVDGDIGTVAATGRTGSSELSEKLWDGIVGAKGRYALGESGKWSLPFYVDVGTGESQLTWQAAAGLSYAFSWGELTGMWRYISYDMKSDSDPIKDLSFNGPMLGATFRW
jgi:hypothetical protein